MKPYLVTATIPVIIMAEDEEDAWDLSFEAIRDEARWNPEAIEDNLTVQEFCHGDAPPATWGKDTVVYYVDDDITLADVLALARPRKEKEEGAHA